MRKALGERARSLRGGGASWWGLWVLVLAGCDQSGLGAASSDLGATVARGSTDLAAEAATVPDGFVLANEPPPAIRAACAALYAGFEERQARCRVPGLRGSRDRLSLVEWCAYRAMLPGIGVDEAALLDCAGRVGQSSCASLPADCQHEPTSWLLPRATNWAIAENGRFLFPAARGQLPPGSGRSDCAQCADVPGYCYDDHRCGVCLRHVLLGAACDAFTACVGTPRAACVDGLCTDVRPRSGGGCMTGPKGEDEGCHGGFYCAPPVDYRPGSGVTWTGTCTARPAVGMACATPSWVDPCQDGSACVGGACRAIVAVGEGEACDTGDRRARRCGEGLYCDQTAVCLRVRPSPPPVGACQQVGDCAAGQACHQGSCASVVGEGASCTGLCAAGTACDWNSNRCVHLGHEGEPCGVGCADGLGCLAGACRRVVERGGACDEGHVCAFPYECRGGSCAAPAVCRP